MRSPLLVSAAAGPLFISRSILVVTALATWILSFVATAGSVDGSPADHARLGALTFDLLGLAMALLASDPRTRRRTLPYLRLLWLGSSVVSGVMTASLVTPTSGYSALTFNVLLGTSMVFLVAMRWDLPGFLLLVVLNAVLSGFYYSLTPRFGSGEGALIFFLSLMPGLLGAAAVVVLRRYLTDADTTECAHLEGAEAGDGQGGPGTGDDLALLHRQIQDLYAQVAAAPSVPLAPELSQHAQRLAGQLRARLLVAGSKDWLTESLALSDMDAVVAVVAQPDVVARIPHASRPRILAVTMLLAAPVDRDAAGEELSRQLHIFVEPHLERTVQVTWNVAGLRPSRCTPALWSEIEALGVPRVLSTPGGASITIRIEAEA